MGSSCFARGNNQTRKTIENFIKDHHLENKVVFKGSHCFSECNEGPVLQVDNEIYKHVNNLNVIDILTEHLLIQ